MFVPAILIAVAFVLALSSWSRREHTPGGRSNVARLRVAAIFILIAILLLLYRYVLAAQ